MMTPKAALILKILLNEYKIGPKEPVLRCLPPQVLQELAAIQETATNSSAFLEPPHGFLSKIHYSWLAPGIEYLPAELRGSVISCLELPQRKQLQRQFATANLSLGGRIQEFLLAMLASLIKPADILPIEILPVTVLTELLDWNKDQLVELIDLLGLHDLVEKIRYIVDKNRLKSIYQCLNVRKQLYLKMCLQTKERLAATPLDLDRWDGDPQKLETMLHKRGLLRLGKALSGQHPSFQWHLIHHLDTGRGTLIQKHCESKENPSVIRLLEQQVSNVMNFLKT